MDTHEGHDLEGTLNIFPSPAAFMEFAQRLGPLRRINIPWISFDDKRNLHQVCPLHLLCEIFHLSPEVWCEDLEDPSV